jgi:tetratricopeptide (TPR) repeat protein
LLPAVGAASVFADHNSASSYNERGENGAARLRLEARDGRIGMSNPSSLDIAPLGKSAPGKPLIDQRFHEGLCLAAGGDYERSGAAFLDCVVDDPGSGAYVQEFLANLTRRSAAAATGKNVPATSDAVQRAAAKADWAQVLERGLRVLMEDARNLQALLALADAAGAQGYSESEACYVKAAVEAAGEDAAIQRWGAAALTRLGKYGDALACWRRVEALDPSDEEAPEAIAGLVIAKCRQRAGLDDGDAQARPQEAKNRGGLAARWPVYSFAGLLPTTEGSGRALTLIQQLEATIRERPSIPEPYLRLAELYLEKDREYDAERLLTKGREATENDARVTQMWEEVAMLRFARRIEAAERELKAADNPQTREALAQVIRERDRGEIEIFRNRIKREPDRAQHYFELGRRLLRAGKLTEAAEQFKKALDDAQLETAAALELGDCHAKLGDLVQALRFYRRAAQTPSSAASEKSQARQRATKLVTQLKLTRLAERYQKVS